MNEQAAMQGGAAAGTETSETGLSGGMKIGYWITKILTVVIFTVPAGWVPKLILTSQSAALVEKLDGYGGQAAVYGIGVIELAAVILLLIPKTALIGSAIAVVTMLGAIVSHVSGIVGMEGDFAMIFVMAIVGLLASGAHGFLELKRLGKVG